MSIQPRGEIAPERRYTSEQVAELLFGRRAEWFYRNRRRLEREDGFPPPISSIGHPLWQGRVLLDWACRHTFTQRPAANDDAEPARPEPLWESVVGRRLAGMAAG